MSDPKLPTVYIASGAFDCGKTTTLEWLRTNHRINIHAEAHLLALASLGTRSAGHPPDASFTPIDDPAHLCPMCRPWAFAELVLEQQREIERAAGPGHLLERGYLDPIEMLLRNTNAADDAPRPAWTPITRYARVFLFEVMPQLQRPRWGKDTAQRTAEAVAINRRLERLYRDAGFDVIRIPPASVEARANALLATIQTK
jgi:predicted ATPase